jgi:hypothetical protein
MYVKTVSLHSKVNGNTTHLSTYDAITLIITYDCPIISNGSSHDVDCESPLCCMLIETQNKY